MTSRITFLFWIVINAIPFFIFEYYPRLLEHNPFLQVKELNILLCALPFVWGAELYFSAFLLSWLRSRILQATIISILWAYHFIIILNWAYFGSTKTFLKVRDLSLFRFFEDKAMMLSLSSPHEIAIILIAVIIAFAASAYFLTVSKRNSTKFLLKQALINLGFSIAFISIPFLLYGGNIYEQRAGFIRHFMSPRTSLLISHAILSGKDDYQKLNLDELNLETLNTGNHSSSSSTNVLLIIVEALRFDSFKSSMPLTNKFVHDFGVVNKGFAAGTDTSYAQTTLITGQYPLRFPSRDYNSDISYPNIPIYEYFKRLNYRTAQFANEFSNTSLLTTSSGLDKVFNSDSYRNSQLKKYLHSDFRTKSAQATIPNFIIDAAYVDHFIDWIAEEDVPFLSTLYFESSHFPYDFIPKYMGKPKTEHPPLPSQYSFFSYSDQHAPLFKTRYHNTLHYLDQVISRLLESLRKEGLLENTLIIFTGDHGEGFHDPIGVTHGREITSAVTEVPIAFIGLDAKNAFQKQCTASHIDIYPTILDFLDLPVPKELQGVSLLNPKNCLARPKFIVSQGLKYQTALVSDGTLMIHDHQSDSFILKNQQLSDGNTHVLEQCLRKFRSQQLSYYDLEQKVRSKYAPPKLQSCL